jgi:RimJ/RimL family protein N-acetyltransferase
MQIEVKKVTNEDWEVYRAVRLASLIDSPASFSSSYANELKYSEEKWRSILEPHDVTRSSSMPLLARVNSEPASIGLGYIHNIDSQVGCIYQMWTKPEYRNKGCASKILQSIIIWAKESKLHTLDLSITTANKAATALYLSSGFKELANSEGKKLNFSLVL